MSYDDGVIATNDDAASCKRFAVNKGYWKDDYIQYFVRMMPERKAPEISRGYYARVEGMKILLTQFLEMTGRNCQVVNLGAGFDTLFWQLHADKMFPTQGFFEVDLKPVVTRKCMAIKSRRQLHDAFPEGGLVIENDEAHSSLYHLIAADITNVAQMEDKLLKAGLNLSIPTIFLAECVLIYLDPKDSNEILEWVARRFETAMFINYQPVNLTDRFGQVMLENLQSRHCTLLGAKGHPTVHHQKEVFVKVGWEGAKAKDMMEVYRKLPKEDVTHVEKLEFLDEVNLLHDLLRHYCISWAFKDKKKLGLEEITF
ncbi:leucine carboxyl methyltransferase 1-like [Rhopilema esculentum]|uniref:leucine carboxyl methyltransferase 1-like n=1 Tax=Rhopilema esculentum TaxID=499914 RepID=UPI0031D3344C